jgi:hypothetical protein
VHNVWWPNRRHTYSSEFQASLATTTSPVEIANLTDIFDYNPGRH